MHWSILLTFLLQGSYPFGLAMIQPRMQRWIRRFQTTFALENLVQRVWILRVDALTVCCMTHILHIYVLLRGNIHH